MLKKLVLMTVLVLPFMVYGRQWQMAGDRIRTEWADEVSPESPLPEYPRPQMIRERWRSLNGLWSYSIESADGTVAGSTGRILVPYPVESSLSGVGLVPGPDSVLVYRRTFRVPAEWRDERVMLNFGAVDWKAEVYVNGSKAGEHTGGFSPFSIDITDFLSRKGRQFIEVRVSDGTDSRFQPRGKQVLRPSRIFYTSVTGIWQTVWIEPVGKVHVCSYDAVADVVSSVLSVTVNAPGADSVRVEVLEGSSSFEAGVRSEEARVVASVSGLAGMELPVGIPDARLWSPDSPYLYGLRITGFDDGEVSDMVYGYAAMRQAGVAEDADGHRRLTLNGKPLFQFGLLDQGWWPDGLYTAPTDDALVFDIRKAKDLGYNMLRKHVKVEPARWYYHCDRLGMLVWQDMPSIARNRSGKWVGRSYEGGRDCLIDAAGKENFFKEWEEIMRFCKVFPSVVMWIPFNEAWGQFETEKVAAFTAGIDSTRPVSPASGGNHVLCGDVLDLHNYPDPQMYLHNRDYVNVIGEYGGLSLVTDGHLWKPDDNWGYVMYGSGDELLRVYEEYARRLEEFIGNGLSAAVYTQISDVEREVNGLMTYDRKVVKVDEARLAAINRAVIDAFTATCRASGR